MYVDPTVSGITTVIGDNANIPVEYYNLQGMLINQPRAGQLVIRRQGGNTSKIIAE